VRRWAGLALTGLALGLAVVTFPGRADGLDRGASAGPGAGTALPRLRAIAQAEYWVGDEHVLIVRLTHEGGGPAYQSSVRATYYRGGAVLSVGTAYAPLRMLRAGETSFVAIRSAAPIGWDRYGVEVAGRYTSTARAYTHDGLALSELRSGRDGRSVRVTGRVTNVSPDVLVGVRVPVGLFDARGTLVDAAYTAPFGERAARPGESVAFGLTFPDPAGRFPADYTYLGQAEGYRG
jgi:hypothetical protein